MVVKYLILVQCLSLLVISEKNFEIMAHGSESNKMVTAIINGKSVGNHQYAFIAGLGTKSTTSEFIEWHCGGSIISQQMILTAAHCKGVTNIMVGSNYLIDVKHGDTITQFNFIPHELFDEAPGPYDIAIIRLLSNLKFNDNVNAITLASMDDIKAGWPEEATVAGFGTALIYGQTPTKILTQIQVNKQPCPSKYLNITNQICYGLKNGSTCRGDSGGPLFVKNQFTGNYLQIGIVSYGLAVCAQTPTAFTSIHPYRYWINMTAKERQKY